MKHAWLVAIGLVALVSGCGRPATTASPSTPHSCGASPTLDYAGHIHCLRTPPSRSTPSTTTSSRPSTRHVVTRKPSSVWVGGFHPLAPRYGEHVPSQELQAIGHALSRPRWSLTVLDYAANPVGVTTFSQEPGLQRQGPPSLHGPVAYSLNGPWGTLPLNTETVQATQTQALAPDLVWSYTTFTPVGDGPLSSTQAEEAAQVLQAQFAAMQNAADAVAQNWPTVPMITLQITNPTGNTLGLTQTTWLINNVPMGSSTSAYPPSGVINWISQTL